MQILGVLDGDPQTNVDGSSFFVIGGCHVGDLDRPRRRGLDAYPVPDLVQAFSKQGYPVPVPPPYRGMGTGITGGTPPDGILNTLSHPVRTGYEEGREGSPAVIFLVVKTEGRARAAAGARLIEPGNGRPARIRLGA